MSTGNTAREAILQRIRTALRDFPPREQLDDVVVERNYRHSGTETREEVVERFIERVAEYKVTVQRVEEASLPQAITAACTARGFRRLVVPVDLPEHWLSASIESLRDSNTLTNEQ